MSVMVRLKVDFEFTSRTWWENGGQDLWDGIAEDFDGSGILVDEDLAKSWITEAARIEGWDEGTDYSPHPVSVAPINEDEEL